MKRIKQLKKYRDEKHEECYPFFWRSPLPPRSSRAADNGLDRVQVGRDVSSPFRTSSSRNPVRIASDRRATGRQRADYAAIDNYMVSRSEGRGKSWLTVLDRADGQPAQNVQTALNTKRWTAFAFNRIANKRNLSDCDMLYFQQSHDRGQRRPPSGSGCYVTGFAPTSTAPTTSGPKDSNVAGTTSVSFAIRLQHGAFRKCRPDQRFRRQERRAERTPHRSRTCGDDLKHEDFTNDFFFFVASCLAKA